MKSHAKTQRREVSKKAIESEAPRLFRKFHEPGDAGNAFEFYAQNAARKEAWKRMAKEFLQKETKVTKEWIDCTVSLPDSDLTVLVYMPEDDTPIWFGYYDGEEWCAVDSSPYLTPVTHWMDFPEPPEK